MKNIILTALFIGALTLAAGCATQNATNEETLTTVGDITLYNNENLNISFAYPPDWEIHDEVDSTALIASPDGRISIYIPGKSSEEYEDKHKEEIQENYISVKDAQLTFGNKSYQVKEYGQHGGTTYIIKIDNQHINILSEYDLSSEHQAISEIKNQLGIILDSLAF